MGLRSPYKRPNKFSFLSNDPQGDPSITGRSDYQQAGSTPYSTFKGQEAANTNATDIGFEVPARNAAIGGLSNALTTADPEDVAATQAVRSALGERLAGLQGGMAQRKGQLESDLAQGFRNQVGEVRRQAGGTGTMGSSTYGSQIGDVASQYQNARAKALQDLESQGTAEINQIGQGLAGTRGQDTAERQLQYAQAQGLSNLLLQTVAQDLQREQMLRGLRSQESMAEKSMWGNLFGGAGQAGGMAIAASDESVKENIYSAEEDITEFFYSTKPYSYEYKDKKYGSGRFVSPMAQDLEKSELGKNLVLEIDGVKHVDYGKAFGLMFAAISSLTNEVRELKKKIGEK